ncbi:hypothetical protein OY671_004948 [Metschnikowia pulcherrima]|nr:hypothetical protein OY671_004948 [Metschnikowia pulcherrima]
MAVHPYRQKSAQPTPYPVSELEQFASSSGEFADPSTPLDSSTQLNRPADPAMLASPRFNVTSENSYTSDIPDITEQLSRQKLYPDDSSASSLQVGLGQDSNLDQNDQTDQQNYLTPDQNSLIHHPQAVTANHRHQESRSSSLGSYQVPSPLYGHQRSVSSTSSVNAQNDFNQSLIYHHLGNNGQSLIPRMKTLEMYRKNARKSNDPAVLYQYASHMLQTALNIDSSSSSSAFSEALRPTTSQASPPSKRAEFKRTHLRSASSVASEPGTSSSSDADMRASLLKEAQFYLRKLSDKGYLEAEYLLGDCLASGVFGKPDHKEAFNLFLAAAKHGHRECAFRTAHCYEEGLGTGRDARKGVEFLKTAASKNHPAAMYKLGIYLFHGRMGINDAPVNKKLGIKWLERASEVATELTSAAPYELGKLYQTGYSDILIKDEKYALTLFTQAAALGNIEASAIMGRHYETGDIVPKNDHLSIHFYSKAAMGGHASSMVALCAWYMVGSEPDLPYSPPEAFSWAMRAAKCDHSKAQFVVANFLDKGIGCDANPTEAQEWYIKAAENGESKALLRINDSKKVAAITKVLKKTKKYVPPTTDDKTAQEQEAHDKDCVIM